MALRKQKTVKRLLMPDCLSLLAFSDMDTKLSTFVPQKGNVSFPIHYPEAKLKALVLEQRPPNICVLVLLYCI